MGINVKGNVTALIFVAAQLFACPARADSMDDSLWQSAAGQLPTHGWFGWEMVRGGSPMPTMILSNGVLELNSTPQNDIDDIGFVGETMYVLDVVTTSNPQNSHLYTVDPQTGLTTFVGTTGKINSGLAYHAGAGSFYSSRHGSRELLRISPLTAETTVVGTTHSVLESGSLLYAVAFASPAGQTQMQIVSESGNAVLDWPAFQGFYYQLFSSTNLTSWSTEGVPAATNGTLLSKALPMGPEPTKFYSVEVVTP